MDNSIIRPNVVIKVIISTAFLIAVWEKIDISLIANSLKILRLKYFLGSFICLIITSFLLAIKYKILLSMTKIKRSITELIKINFLCRFYSMFLTSFVGQGVIRWHNTTKGQGEKVEFVVLIIIERISYFFAIIIAIYTSSVFAASLKLNPHLQDFYSILRATAVILISLTILIIWPFPLKKFTWKSPGKNNHNVSRKIMFQLRQASKFLLKSEKRYILKSFIVAIVWQLFFVLRIYFLGVSTGVSYDFNQLCWIASTALIFQSLPISFNGIGVREATYAYLFQLNGLQPEFGVTLGLLIFVQLFITSIVGGIIQLLAE